MEGGVDDQAGVLREVRCHDPFEVALGVLGHVAEGLACVFAEGEDRFVAVPADAACAVDDDVGGEHLLPGLPDDRRGLQPNA